MEIRDASHHLLSIKECKFDQSKIFSPIEYVDVKSDDDMALLHGNFTADQLLAIAFWMKNSDMFTEE
tara:strand:+ start:50 stop:250 length:201 start_codon:yes stop_codon:yes gene_type:complete